MILKICSESVSVIRLHSEVQPRCALINLQREDATTLLAAFPDNNTLVYVLTAQVNNESVLTGGHEQT